MRGRLPSYLLPDSLPYWTSWTESAYAGWLGIDRVGWVRSLADQISTASGAIASVTWLTPPPVPLSSPFLIRLEGTSPR